MKKSILFISPGPTYRPHTDLYESQFKALSNDCKGYIFTTTTISETFIIGDFTHISMKHYNSKGRLILFVLFCLWNALKLLLKREKIDLVISYEPFLSGPIGLMVSFLLRAKFVQEVNGVYTSEAEWLDVPNTLGMKLKRISYSWMMHYVLKHSDGIKLLFRNQVDPFRQVLKGKTIQSFPCFVPVGNFRNICEKKEILFVGFPFKRKGVDLLIEAFKRIAPKYPEWKLKILGWFPDQNELNKAIDGHLQIYHHKPVQRHEMPEHIGSCAILVLPSRSEAMGRVLVEAMAAGKPRVGSNVDGIPTVINDGVDGLLFESENVEDLASKLDMLMGNQDLRRKLGDSGEIRARKEFTSEEYGRNLNEFCNQVLSA